MSEIRPIMLRCNCGFGKHYTWAGFIRCMKEIWEDRR